MFTHVRVSGIHMLTPVRVSGIHMYTYVRVSGIHMYTHVRVSGIHMYTHVRVSGIHTFTHVRVSGIHTYTHVRVSGIHTFTHVEKKLLKDKQISKACFDYCSTAHGLSCQSCSTAHGLSCPIPVEFVIVNTYYPERFACTYACIMCQCQLISASFAYCSCRGKGRPSGLLV